ncbi:MAG: serine protease [Mesorhizobium sp.]|nr:MAG: serine protease [Mesorhizobium sp.]
MLVAKDGENVIHFLVTADQIERDGLDALQRAMSGEYDAGKVIPKYIHMTPDFQRKFREWSPAEFMMYSATRITCMTAGEITSYGTGFFYHSNDGEYDYFLLATNKHVLKDADEIFFCLNIGGDEPNGGIVEYSHKLGPSQIIGHPDPDVDLCVTNISGAIQAAMNRESPPYFAAINAKQIPSDEDWRSLDAIESVTMVGCPDGLYDETNALAITRSGYTSSHPGKAYDGRNEFLVDIACFAGSSGSPIFRYDRGGGRWDKFTRRHVPNDNVSLLLLGILYAGPMVTIDNEGFIEIDGRAKVEIESTMHLGFAIRSSELLVVEKIFHEDSGRRRASGEQNHDNNHPPSKMRIVPAA